LKFLNNIKNFSVFDRKGPEFDNSLFDLYGHSPLVEYYLYNNKGRKINNAVTLVQHPYITELPALSAMTYNDVIKQELKAIKKLEKELKELVNFSQCYL
jgi:hypothetical protein